MPKGKKKSKSERNGRIADVQTPLNLTSDEDSAFDNASVISLLSETTNVPDEDPDIDDVSQQEAFEEKLSEAIDGLTQKSAQGRTSCFDAVCKALTAKYIPDWIYDRRFTLTDCVERGVKKGRGQEQACAAALAPLLCVQLGAGDSSEEICRSLRPILSTTAHDNTAAAAARSKCCWALGLITFLAGGEIGDVLELMREMHNVFSGSYLKGDGSVAAVDGSLAALHASALSSWSLLLTLLSPGDVYSFLSNGAGSFAPSLKQLVQLLQSLHLEVRMAAGEAIVLAFEQGRTYNEDFAEDFVPDLIEDLRQLATDSHKYRAKKDRKQQRATFRDILHFIEEDIYSDVQVRFGQEVLCLDSWSRRKQYDVLCQTLGSGLNLHLAENDLVREVFQLGPKILVGDTQAIKQSKLERHLMNAANFKARTISRSKNRDKRFEY